MMPDYDYDRNDEQLDDLEPNEFIHDTSDEVLRIDYLTAIYELAKVHQCQYADGPAVAKDVMNSDREDAYSRLFCLLYWDMLDFSNHIFYHKHITRNKKKLRHSFKYSNAEDRQEVQEIIAIGLVEVLNQLRCIPESVNGWQTVSDARYSLILWLRNKCTYKIYKQAGFVPYKKEDRKTSLICRKELIDMDILNNKALTDDALVNPERIVSNKVKDRFIKKKILEFLKDYDLKDRQIFLLTIMKTGEFDGYIIPLSWSNKEIADNFIGIAESTLYYRIKRLKKDFCPYFAKEIAPYL